MSIFGPQKRSASPLGGQSGSYRSGSLGLRGPYVSRDGSLGAVNSSGVATVPWQCWSAPGFQDCHPKSYAQAVQTCDAATVRDLFGGNKDLCITSYSDSFDIQNCVPKYCPAQVVPKGGRAPLSTATVKQIQTQLNQVLTAKGYKTITVDGRLGPATCGAAFYLRDDSPIYTNYQLGDGYCNGAMTNPTKVGSTVPMQTHVAATTTVVPGQPATTAANPAWGVQDPAVAMLQANLNQILDANNFLSIPISGMLDAKTCGAMKWIRDNTGQDFLFGSGANCQSFTMPTRKPASLSPESGNPGDPPPSSLLPTPPPPGGMTSASVLTGGLLLLAAGGAYYYAKKQGMV